MNRAREDDRFFATSTVLSLMLHAVVLVAGRVALAPPAEAFLPDFVPITELTYLQEEAPEAFLRFREPNGEENAAEDPELDRSGASVPAVANSAELDRSDLLTDRNVTPEPVVASSPAPPTPPPSVHDRTSFLPHQVLPSPEPQSAEPATMSEPVLASVPGEIVPPVSAVSTRDRGGMPREFEGTAQGGSVAGLAVGGPRSGGPSPITGPGASGPPGERGVEASGVGGGASFGDAALRDIYLTYRQRVGTILVAEIQRRFRREAVRRDEGVVSFQLEVAVNGQIRVIQLASESSLLQRVTREALAVASIPLPPSSLSTPLPLRFRTRFTLES